MAHVPTLRSNIPRSNTDQQKLQRLQVELSPQRIEALQLIMSVSGIETKKELINNALTLMQWAIEEVQRGNQIVSLNKNHKKYNVLTMPALMHAADFATKNMSQRIQEDEDEEEFPDLTKIGLAGPN